MAPRMHDPDTHQNLTGNHVSTLSYRPVTTRQTREHGAQFCLMESPEYKCFDLCYSFKTLVHVEYGSLQQLHDAAWNYWDNWAKIFGTGQDVRMSYEKALWNLIIFMFGHYIDASKCHGAWKGHWAILALKCFTVVDELGRFQKWYKIADLRKSGVMKTQWKELPREPQDDCCSSYNLALAAMGIPKQPSYGHPKLLGQYFDHVYHQSQNIGQLTRKSQDKATDYNESVYNQKLAELLSYLQGSGDLNYLPRHRPGPTSLLNPEIILSEADFRAAYRKKKGWISEKWTYREEEPNQYCCDHLEAQLDWNGDPKDLEREEDDVDKKDHEALYSELDDYPGDMPDLEETESVNTSVYDRLGATPASTTISTDMEAAGDMFNLSMGPLELPAPQEANDSMDQTDEALSDDDQLQDMFKVPIGVLVSQDPPLSRPQLDPQVLMAQAKLKSGRQTLPPPPELRAQKDDPDTRNVVL